MVSYVTNQHRRRYALKDMQMLLIDLERNGFGANPNYRSCMKILDALSLTLTKSVDIMRSEDPVAIEEYYNAKEK